MIVSDGTPPPPPITLPALTIPPGMSPLDAKSLVTQAINLLVPPDKHVALVNVVTRDSAGVVSDRFAAAQRVGGHLQFHEELAFAHGAGGHAWTGEVSVVGVW